MTTAQWKPILGYEGFYDASTQGQIRSLTRQVARKAGSSAEHAGRMLKIHITATGAAQVRLCREGQRSLHSAARLILSAFDPPADPTDLAVAKNGDYTNLALDNLQWMTPSQAAKHRKGKA